MSKFKKEKEVKTSVSQIREIFKIDRYSLLYDIGHLLTGYCGQIINFPENYSKFKIKYFYNKYYDYYSTGNLIKGYSFYTPKKFFILFKNIKNRNSYRIILKTIKEHYKPEHITIRKFLRTTL